jgi:hypothetical protein
VLQKREKEKHSATTLQSSPNPPAFTAVKNALLRLQKLTASMVGLSQAAPSTVDASPAVKFSVQFCSTSCSWL